MHYCHYLFYCSKCPRFDHWKLLQVGSRALSVCPDALITHNIFIFSILTYTYFQNCWPLLLWKTDWLIWAQYLCADPLVFSFIVSHWNTITSVSYLSYSPPSMQLRSFEIQFVCYCLYSILNFPHLLDDLNHVLGVRNIVMVLRVTVTQNNLIGPGSYLLMSKCTYIYLYPPLLSYVKSSTLHFSELCT